MKSFLTNGNRLATLGIIALSAGTLYGTFSAALQHKIGNLDSVLTALMAVTALAFVPPVLAELRDRQTLSVYRAMRRK